MARKKGAKPVPSPKQKPGCDQDKGRGIMPKMPKKPKAKK